MSTRTIKIEHAQIEEVGDGYVEVSADPGHGDDDILIPCSDDVQRWAGARLYTPVEIEMTIKSSC